MIIERAVLKGELAAQFVIDFGCPLKRHLEAHHRFFASIKPALDLFRGECAAVTVISRRLFGSFLGGPYGIQPFRTAEAVIGVAIRDQLPGIFMIQIQTLRLEIGTVWSMRRGVAAIAGFFVRTASTGSFIPVQTEPFQAVHNVLE